MTQTIDRKAAVRTGARTLTPSLAPAAFGFVPPRNRRREVRRAVRLPCSVVRKEDWQLLGNQTVDLSPNGMLFLSNEHTDAGSEVLVGFLATELPIWFDTNATVTRIVEGGRRATRGQRWASASSLCLPSLV